MKVINHNGDEDLKVFEVQGRHSLLFGNLFAGTLASWIGAPDTLIVSGAACIIGSLVFASNLPQIRKEVRPIYIKMGIIPGIE